MEAIIIFLIISALSSFFNKGKEKETETTKPVVPQPKRRQEPTTDKQDPLQDLSRQLFEKLKEQRPVEETQPPIQEVEKTPMQLAYEEKLRERELERDRGRQSDRSSAREVMKSARRQKAEWESEGLAVYDDVWAPKQKELKQEDLLPKTNQDLLKGIIFAEIMHPPKSLRQTKHGKIK
ncbi:hypothetical protein IRY55_02245 [Savagea sp. SN6]|uniref:Uncharacterized protein n=1 Tax=Savagea serpentis TaxID=2785297 RepID=A0A8J7G102_9BACL|nr:hypothetical protein [Savagea serpentis]MBF4500170.1 hypothetical protein [Savagea serpentis]